MTPGRGERPRETGTLPRLKKRACPLCPSGIEKNFIIKTYPVLKKNQQWSITVLKNKYPVVSLQNSKAYGQHEVIVETPDHNRDLAQFGSKEMENLLRVYQDRTRELSKIPKINYVLIFKNEGGKAGASLRHAHSQVFAAEILPPDLEEEFRFMRAYQKKHKTCPYCNMIRKEEKGSRMICRDEHMVAFTPYASAYHYETWIFPRRHLDNVVDLNGKEIPSLAKFLRKILGKMYRMDLSYNFFLHQVVSEKNQHFYVKIQPRESVWGGLELGSGLVVSSLLPEKAAGALRK